MEDMSDTHVPSLDAEGNVTGWILEGCGGGEMALALLLLMIIGIVALLPWYMLYHAAVELRHKRWLAGLLWAIPPSLFFAGGLWFYFVQGEDDALFVIGLGPMLAGVALLIGLELLIMVGIPLGLIALPFWASVRGFRAAKVGEKFVAGLWFIVPTIYVCLSVVFVPLIYMEESERVCDMVNVWVVDDTLYAETKWWVQGDVEIRVYWNGAVEKDFQSYSVPGGKNSLFVFPYTEPIEEVVLGGASKLKYGFDWQKISTSCWREVSIPDP